MGGGEGGKESEEKEEVKGGGTPRDKYLAWHVGQALTGSFRNGIIPPEVLAQLAESKISEIEKRGDKTVRPKDTDNPLVGLQEPKPDKQTRISGAGDRRTTVNKKQLGK